MHWIRLGALSWLSDWPCQSQSGFDLEEGSVNTELDIVPQIGWELIPKKEWSTTKAGLGIWYLSNYEWYEFSEMDSDKYLNEWNSFKAFQRPIKKVEEWIAFSNSAPVFATPCEYVRLSRKGEVTSEAKAGLYREEYSRFYTHWKPWTPSPPPRPEKEPWRIALDKRLEIASGEERDIKAYKTGYQDGYNDGSQAGLKSK